MDQSLPDYASVSSSCCAASLSLQMLSLAHSLCRIYAAESPPVIVPITEAILSGR